MQELRDGERWGAAPYEQQDGWRNQARRQQQNAAAERDAHAHHDAARHQNGNRREPRSNGPRARNTLQHHGHVTVRESGARVHN
jgi:hypothetical protein